jgi:hypothetical protein
LVFIAQIGDWDAIDQVPFDDRYLLLGRKMPPLTPRRAIARGAILRVSDK